MTKKGSKTKTKAKDKPLLELAAKPSFLHSLLSAAEQFDNGDCFVQVFKGGITLQSLNRKFTEMFYIAVNRGAFLSYRCRNPVELTLNYDNLTALTAFASGKKDSIPLALEVYEDKIKMTWQHLHGKTKLLFDSMYKDNVGVVIEQLKKIYPKCKKLTVLKAEPFSASMKKVLKFKPDAYAPDICTFQKDKDGPLEFFREIGTNDIVTFELPTTAKGRKSKDEYKAAFEIERVYNSVKYMAPLSPEIVIMGETDFPLVLSAHGGNPADATIFKQNIDYWRAMAPYIIAE